jgi:AcrR family transcriptional regulator
LPAAITTQKPGFIPEPMREICGQAARLLISDSFRSERSERLTNEHSFNYCLISLGTRAAPGGNSRGPLRLPPSMAELSRTQPQDDALVRARRRQIFLAACRVLARKSFHEATVKELAIEAGLAAGSIYVYLQSKDDILILIAESMVAELVEALPSIHARSGADPRRELLDVTRTILDVIDRYREAFSVLHHEVRYLVRRPQHRHALSKIVDQYFSAVSEVLARGRERELIRFDDLRSVVQAIHMMCSGWATGANYLKNTSKETYWREIAAMIEGRFCTPEDNSHARGHGPAQGEN